MCISSVFTILSCLGCPFPWLWQNDCLGCDYLLFMEHHWKPCGVLPHSDLWEEAARSWPDAVSSSELRESSWDRGKWVMSRLLLEVFPTVLFSTLAALFFSLDFPPPWWHWRKVKIHTKKLLAFCCHLFSFSWLCHFLYPCPSCLPWLAAFCSRNCSLPGVCDVTDADQLNLSQCLRVLKGKKKR